jgi:fumarate hydratase subunit beta
MTVHRIACSPSAEQVAALPIGDLVYLSGEIVVTGGLPAHQRILEYLDEMKPLPIPLDGVFIHLPHMAEEQPDGGYAIHHVNPTPSRRFDSYMPRIIGHHDLRIAGGMGGLGEELADAMARKGWGYLSMLGGGNAILWEAIKQVLAVEWCDFPPHFRLAELLVENLGPLTVGINATGNSIYRKLEDQARSRLPQIISVLSQRRADAARTRS